MAMRFLTTCLLLFCFQSFVVCTIEDGSVTFVKENTSSKSVQLTKLVAKNLSTETITSSVFECVDIIQHHVAHQRLSTMVPVFLFADRNISLESIKYFDELSNHSYSFIFRCLYPKHTFW